MTLAEWEGYELEPDAEQLDEPAQATVAELEQKLADAQAEIRRCQTRLFAYERAMMALRRENAELEAKCEKARALSESLSELFGGSAPRRASPVHCRQPINLSGAPLQWEQEPLAQPVHNTYAEPPKTELQRVAYELIGQFDLWLEQNKK